MKFKVAAVITVDAGGREGALFELAELKKDVEAAGAKLEAEPMDLVPAEMFEEGDGG